MSDRTNYNPIPAESKPWLVFGLACLAALVTFLVVVAIWSVDVTRSNDSVYRTRAVSCQSVPPEFRTGCLLAAK